MLSQSAFFPYQRNLCVGVIGTASKSQLRQITAIKLYKAIHLLLVTVNAGTVAGSIVSHFLLFEINRDRKQMQRSGKNASSLLLGIATHSKTAQKHNDGSGFVKWAAIEEAIKSMAQ